MSKSNAFETAFNALILNNTPIAGLGDVTGIPGSAVPGSVFVALHTADPGEAGNQSTNEVAYGAYARVAVPRTAGGWTLAGANAENAAAVTFPTCTSGSATATHFSVGLALAGATMILFKGALTASLAISTGISPFFPAGQLTGAED